MNNQDMSLPPEEFLLSIINYRYGHDFTFNDFYFGERIDVDAYGCESMIYMHSRPGGKFTGTMRAYYNRVTLNEFLNGEAVQSEWKVHFDTDDLLPDVKDQLGINLPREDIVSDIIDQTAPYSQINISGRSIVFRGYVPVLFTGHPDTLGARVANKELNGFN